MGTGYLKRATKTATTGEAEVRCQVIHVDGGLTAKEPGPDGDTQ